MPKAGGEADLPDVTITSPPTGWPESHPLFFSMQARCSRRNFVKQIKNDTRFKSPRLNLLRTSAATTPLDGDRHRAMEPLARLRLCRGTARALPALRLALDRHVQRRGAGPRVPRLCLERERGGRGVQLFRLDRFGWAVRPNLGPKIRSKRPVIFSGDNRSAI